MEFLFPPTVVVVEEEVVVVAVVAAVVAAAAGGETLTMREGMSVVMTDTKSMITATGNVHLVIAVLN